MAARHSPANAPTRPLTVIDSQLKRLAENSSISLPVRHRRALRSIHFSLLEGSGMVDFPSWLQQWWQMKELGREWDIAPYHIDVWVYSMVLASIVEWQERLDARYMRVLREAAMGTVSLKALLLALNEADMGYRGERGVGCSESSSPRVGTNNSPENADRRDMLRSLLDESQAHDEQIERHHQSDGPARLAARTNRSPLVNSTSQEIRQTHQEARPTLSPVKEPFRPHKSQINGVPKGEGSYWEDKDRENWALNIAARQGPSNELSASLSTPSSAPLDPQDARDLENLLVKYGGATKPSLGFNLGERAARVVNPNAAVFVPLRKL